MTLMEPLKPFAASWKPHNYQKRAMKFLLEHGAGALFLDPGLGKTSITLGAIKVAKKRGVINRALVLAPVRVIHNAWPSEVEKWADFNKLRMQILHGPKRDQALATDADIYVTNYDSLAWLLQAKLTKKVSAKTGKETTHVDVDYRRFKQLGFDTLVIDELSKLKNYNSIRFKLLKAVNKSFQRRWGLTGSPAANGMMGLFGEMLILDEGRTFGPYITHYQREYFMKHPSGFSWVLQPGADERIFERLAPMALRMAAEDYIEMPQLVFNVIKVVMPPAARLIYDQMERDMLAKLESGLVTAANSGVAAGKCRQIASGGVFKTPELNGLVKLPRSLREWVNLHDEKTDAIDDLLEELEGQPLIVAYEFEHDLDRLRTRFPDAPVIGRGSRPKDTQHIINNFKDKLTPLLLVQPQSAAHGLDGLQEVGGHICFYTLPYDFENYDQLIRRLYRQGGQERVMVHQLIADDTIDEDVLALLEKKDKGQRALFEALKRLSRRRAKIQLATTL